MKKPAFNIKASSANLLTRMFGDMSDGIVRAAEAYAAIRPAVLPTLKGKLTKDELLALVELREGMTFDPDFAVHCDFVCGEIQERYADLNEDWNIDVDILKSKLRNLTPVQLYFLLEEIERCHAKVCNPNDIVNAYA